MVSRTQKRDEKAQTIERLYQLLGQHKQIIFVGFTNVGSFQVAQIRKTLRAYNGSLVIAKNTLVKKVIRMRTQGIQDNDFKYLNEKYGGKIKQLECLVPILKQKLGMIFCDAPIFEIKNKIEANKIPTEARVGIVAPINFTVPPGPTGMDPSQINFFHALNISTKIVKGQIEITKQFRVTTEGQKVKASESALLKRLSLKPFEYGMKVLKVYDEGGILPEEIVNIDPASLVAKFQNGARNLVGLSLATGYTIEAVVPIMIANSMKNIAALSMESGFKIPELDLLSAGTSAPVAPVKEQPKGKNAPKAKEPEPEPEDDVGGMDDLFG